MRLLLLLVMSVIFVSGRVDDLDDFERMMQEPKNRARWIDPMDMGLLDINSDSCEEVEIKLKDCENDLQECKVRMDKILREIDSTNNKSKDVELVKDKKPEEKSQGMSDVFLRRFVSHLIQKLQLERHRGVHLKLEISLETFQVQTLLNFVSPGSNSNQVDVDYILSSFIRSVDTYETSPFVDNLKLQLSSLKDPLLVVVMSMSLVYIALLVLKRLPPFKVLLVVLTVSLIWHWVHLYKEAWASKHAKLVRGEEVPPECRPKEMTWLQTISSSVSGVFNSVDKCEEYHKAILVDPIYEVNPLTALVDLITKLVLHPVSRLGREVGLMFAGLLQVVPFFWALPILAGFLMLIMFVMILTAGYKVRLPLFLGEIGPAAVGNQNGTNNLALEQEIKDLKMMLGNMKLQNTAIESNPVSKDNRPCPAIEEIKPLGYDTKTGTHSAVEEVDSSEAPAPLTLTPSKRRNRDVILTPVKGRVLSQPNIFRRPPDPRQDEDQENAEDLSLPLKRIDSFPKSPLKNLSVQNAEDLSLPLKRSDSFPKSPLKNLSVQSCDDPKNTKFEWIPYSVEAKAIPSHSPPAAPENETCDNKIDYLTKVEEIFESTPEL